jgi:hypothetical protein
MAVSLPLSPLTRSGVLWGLGLVSMQEETPIALLRNDGIFSCTHFHASHLSLPLACELTHLHSLGMAVACMHGQSQVHKHTRLFSLSFSFNCCTNPLELAGVQAFQRGPRSLSMNRSKKKNSGNKPIEKNTKK